MISYPRWKIVLVAVVLLAAILLALPNLFGEESALQLAADRAAVTDADSKAVVQVLKDKGVTPSGVFLEQGRLTLRFATKQDQLKARDLIAEGGYDPVYGARPLKRAIQQQIENPLAQRILRNEFAPGDRIRVTTRGSELVFEKKRDIRKVAS